MVKNYLLSNDNYDLLVEFISRVEGVHKVFVYINDELLNEKPFVIYVHADNYLSIAPNTILSKKTRQEAVDDSNETTFYNHSFRIIKTNKPYYYVINNQNIQSLRVYGSYLKKPPW